MRTAACVATTSGTSGAQQKSHPSIRSAPVSRLPVSGPRFARSQGTVRRRCSSLVGTTELRILRCAAQGVLAAAVLEGYVAPPPPAISITDKAMAHLRKLRAEHSDGERLLLRIGVKSGGCSGMSYHMDFEQKENLKPDDSVMEYEGEFKLVCDPKSLLYLFGMQLDYSDALIGGGFQFQNPNATSSCGCGKSFGV